VFPQWSEKNYDGTASTIEHEGERIMLWIKAWQKNFLRYLETWIGVSVGIILLGGFCMGIPLLMEQTTDSDAASYLLVAGAVVFLAITVGGTLAYAAFVLRKRRAWLDAAFGEVNIAGKAYLTNGRQYHGRFSGRQVDAYFYRGPMLDVYVSTSLQTRLGLGKRNKVGTLLATFAQSTPLTLTEPEYQGVDAYADDGDWALRWLADSDAKGALARLMASADDVEVRNLNLQPGAIRLSICYTEEVRITPAAVRQWLDDLCAAVVAAERLPAPETSSAPLSPLELASRENRGKFTLPTLLLVIGFLLIPTVCMVLAFVILLSIPAK
jgi:hypothetical protein